MEHLTGDLVGLLDHLKIDKAIFVGHDWGGFVVWQMPLRHPSRALRRRRRQHAALGSRSRPIRSSCFASALATKCTSCSSRTLAREPDRIFGSRVEQDLRCVHAQAGGATRRETPEEQPIAGVGAFAAAQSGVSADDRELRRQARSAHADPVAGEKKKVFVDTFTRTGFTGGINWYRNFSRNWQRSKGLDHSCACTVADDHGRERRSAAAIGRRRHGEARPRSGEVSRARQRSLDAAGKAGGGQCQADRMA